MHLRHPTRDLSRVCEILELTPRYIWKKGDERQTPKGNKIVGIRDSSYCTIEVGPESRKALGERLREVLKLLQPHEGIFRELAAAGGAVSLYVGWLCDDSTGEMLDAQLLEEIAKLRMGLELNIYMPDTSDLERADEP